jgi:hypothetical protein
LLELKDIPIILFYLFRYSHKEIKAEIEKFRQKLFDIAHESQPNATEESKKDKKSKSKKEHTISDHRQPEDKVDDSKNALADTKKSDRNARRNSRERSPAKNRDRDRDYISNDKSNSDRTLKRERKDDKRKSRSSSRENNKYILKYIFFK